MVTTSGFGNNSVTVVVMDNAEGKLENKEVTVKIFHNGVFHMTGILDPLYETSTLNKLELIFKELPSECIKEGGWEHISRRVVLMNYTTSLPTSFTVSRLALQKYFQSRGVRADFEPDVSPCVKIVFPERWTACVFRTGKVNLTSLTSKDDCVKFVEKLTGYLNEYIDSKSS